MPRPNPNAPQRVIPRCLHSCGFASHFCRRGRVNEALTCGASIWGKGRRSNRYGSGVLRTSDQPPPNHCQPAVVPSHLHRNMEGHGSPEEPEVGRGVRSFFLRGRPLPLSRVLAHLTSQRPSPQALSLALAELPHATLLHLLKACLQETPSMWGMVSRMWVGGFPGRKGVGPMGGVSLPFVASPREPCGGRLAPAVAPFAVEA